MWQCHGGGCTLTRDTCSRNGGDPDAPAARLVLVPGPTGLRVCVCPRASPLWTPSPPPRSVLSMPLQSWQGCSGTTLPKPLSACAPLLRWDLPGSAALDRVSCERRRDTGAQRGGCGRAAVRGRCFGRPHIICKSTCDRAQLDVCVCDHDSDQQVEHVHPGLQAEHFHPGLQVEHFASSPCRLPGGLKGLGCTLDRL